MKVNDRKTPTQPLKKKEDSFKARDLNKDGVLTGKELKGVGKMDADGNQELTKDEFVAGTKAKQQAENAERREKAFNKADINDDGILTGKEKAAIAKFDADGNGEISKEEFAAGKSAEWKAKVDKAFDDVFGQLDVTDEGVLSGTEAKKHKDWDADGDGKITRDEAKAGWTADRKEAREKQILTGGRLPEHLRLNQKTEKQGQDD